MKATIKKLALNVAKEMKNIAIAILMIPVTFYRNIFKPETRLMLEAFGVFSLVSSVGMFILQATSSSFLGVHFYSTTSVSVVLIISVIATLAYAIRIKYKEYKKEDEEKKDERIQERIAHVSEIENQS